MKWLPSKLSDLVFFQRGFDITVAQQRDGVFPVISSSGVTSYHDEFKVHGPGVVIGRKGTLGSVHFTTQDYWPHDTTLWSKEMHGNNPKFVYYFLHTLDFKRFDVGNSNPTLNRNHIHDIEIRIPPRSIQDVIADTLTAYDDLTENNRRQMALLEESVRLLYREWFVHLRFPGHEHTPIVNGVPEGWEHSCLQDVCVAGDGIQTGPFGSQLHQSDYVEDGVPVIMPKDIINFRISVDSVARIPEDLADRLGRHRMIEGDTVFGRRGDIGRRAFISKRHTGWFCGTGSLRIRPDPQVVDPRYLFDTLGSPETSGVIANRAKGSTMPNLSGGSLKSVPILLAPRPMQNLYSSQVLPMAAMIEALADQNEKLRQARNLLLPRLMSGEISV